VPVSGGESISTLSADPAQGFRGDLSGIFLSTRYPQRTHCYPHVAAVIHRLIHRLCTTNAQVTGRNSKDTFYSERAVVQFPVTLFPRRAALDLAGA
jgi:hypothetical protein